MLPSARLSVAPGVRSLQYRIAVGFPIASGGILRILRVVMYIAKVHTVNNRLHCQEQCTAYGTVQAYDLSPSPTQPDTCMYNGCHTYDTPKPHNQIPGICPSFLKQTFKSRLWSRPHPPGWHEKAARLPTVLYTVLSGIR